jgi:hypothetical protein
MDMFDLENDTIKFELKKSNYSTRKNVHIY